MRTVEQLAEDVRDLANTFTFPVDEPVYRKARRDPKAPILFAGALGAPVCVFGRDLGRDEVLEGQPLVGAAGRLVRLGLIRAFEGGGLGPGDPKLEAALRHALLANTVPYKPPGNKAYAESVKARFRPFVAELLAAHWTGRTIIPLGSEALAWFSPYAPAGAVEAFARREDRFEGALECVLTATVEGRSVSKPVTILPLPHPSPLNRRWAPLFPELLDRRLQTDRKPNSLGQTS